MSKKYNLFSLDCGNAQIKAVSDQGKVTLPHSLRKLRQSEVDAIEERGEQSSSPGIYKVQGEYFAVGDRAMRQGAGAALYGESRYVPEYYGVLAAIAMSNTFVQSTRSIYLHGSHTPKDVIYRDDLINAVIGRWSVESMGNRKEFTVQQVACFDEPVGAYRHATLADDGVHYRGQDRLRKGDVLIIDVGGFTVGLTRVNKGIVEYEASASMITGVLDVLSEFEQLIRSRFRVELKGQQTLKQDKLRAALADPRHMYDAGGAGVFNVTDEAERALEPLLREIIQFYEQYRGGSSDAILLAGGGSVLLERHLRDYLKHPRIMMADESRNEMHLSTAIGGMKMLKLLESKGRL